MKRKILFIFITIILSSLSSIASVVDSLKYALINSPDSTKFNLYLDIAAQYRGINTDSAIFYNQKAISLAKKLGSVQKLSAASNEMGVVYYLNDQYVKAIECYELALIIDKKLKNNFDIATRLNNIGLAYCAIGNYSIAIDNFHEALKIDHERNDTAKIAIRLNNIGIVYTRFEQYAKALDYFINAYKTDSVRNDKALCAARLSNIGWVYLKMKKPDQAITYLNKAIVIDTELKNEFNLAIRYNNLGNAYLLKKEYNEAINLFDKALIINRKSENKTAIATVLYSLGNAYFETKQIAKALESISESVKLANETHAQNIIIDDYKLFSELYASQNNYKQAFVYSDKYNRLKDSLFTSESKKKLDALQTYYENEKKEHEISILNHEKQLKDLQFKQKEEELNNQRLLKYWLFAVAIIILLVVAVFYISSMNRAIKNRHILEKNLNLYMQKALSQQMNPHFIFNTLNSIQFFLLNNDKIASSKYLSKFARLMRLTLDNSQKPVIPLSDEIESLKLYVELEQLRFENKFSFDLQFDSIPDFELISLPPLILQPFVENSIWHGIMHRENSEGGMLKIKFTSNNNVLICTIEDNGIGRERAKEIRQKKKPDHVSWGTKITESRISLINELHKSKLNIRYTDLKDNNNLPIGTKVEIEFPV
ncbi:MAG: tetratricopeptide repeat protein [Bacteroidia bacterium]|nr:tetratricopeptide repeat protein [Bacteroidia bacterium]